jgi:hypothetical protein
MKYCSVCGYGLNKGTELFCPNCGSDLRQNKGMLDKTEGSISISGIHGDVFGTGFSGSGNIIGKNIVVGSGTIAVSETQLQKIPNEYAQSLKDCN